VLLAARAGRWARRRQAGLAAAWALRAPPW